MKRLILILTFSFILLGCKQTNGQSGKSGSVKSFAYAPMTIPDFFRKLADNHYKDFASIDNSDFKDFCSANGLAETDTVNQKKFYTIKMLHELFTSKTASNGSKGNILNIPYYWHWTTPNPRHQITSLQTNQLLNAVTPPKGFAKYKSYADIDRTPYLFLSELVSGKPLYSSPYGEFSTFGWCSEREMAFTCLMESLGFKGQVITSGNHSWSEFIIPFTKNGTTSQYKFKVDNTFDIIEWQSITANEIKAWSTQKFPGQGNWYNEKAHSVTEKQKVTAFMVSATAMGSIEQKVVDYIKKEL